MRGLCAVATGLLLLNLVIACDADGRLGEAGERLGEALSRNESPVPAGKAPSDSDPGESPTVEISGLGTGGITPEPEEIPAAPPTATPVAPEPGSAIPPGDPGLVSPGSPNVPSVGKPAHFPRVMAFRTSLGELINADGSSDGAVQPEEDFDNLEVVLDKNADFIKAVEQEYGSRVVTLWHRGWGNIGKRTLTTDKSAVDSDPPFPIFAGHWMFEVGTLVSKDIDLTEPRVRIYVEDNSNFSVDGDAMIHYYDAATETHDWTTFEHVQVKEVGSDDSGPFLKVRREAPVEWVTGDRDVQIAPHATIFGPTSWAVNLSLGSPKDKPGQSGREGWEFFADYLYDRWKNDLCTGDDIQVCPDGIELDGGRWLPNNQGSPDILVDSDNDGFTDYGYVNGIQAYGLGGVRSLEALRERLPDSLVVVDSSTPSLGFRGYNHINGIEMENFPETNRTYGTVDKRYLTGFSSAFLHLRQWVENVVESTAFSYGFTKHYTKNFGCNGNSGDTNSTFRIGLASDLMVGMPHPYIAEVPAGEKCFSLYLWDEYFGGALDDWDWLGSASTDALRVLDNLDLSIDLLAGVSWQGGTGSCTLEGGGSNQATLSGTTEPGSYELQVTKVCSVPSVSGAFIRTLEGGLDLSTDFSDAVAYTIRFDVQAANTYNNDPDYAWVAGVPRLLRVSLEMDDRNSTLDQDIQVNVDAAKATIYLSFLDVPRGNARKITGVRFESGEATGSIKIGQPQLFAGSAERWIRYFQNGAVVLNATHDDWDLELSPSESVTLAYSRLKGDQDLVSSGDEGAGVSINRFTIPAEDALFVTRNR